MGRTSGRELVIRIALLALLATSCLAAAAKSRTKKKVTKEAKEVNVCNIEGNQAPVFCYCDKNEKGKANLASCLVLGKFNIDDPIWSHFMSQLHLRKLTFTVRANGKLDYVPTAIFGYLKDLETVAIEYAKIDELAERSFSNLPNMSSINLTVNTLVTLRKYAFENMKNLDTINLNENRIAEIDKDVFVNLPALTTLYLNQNNISIIHDKAFTQLSSLQRLELKSNRISVITRDCFHGLRRLKSLDLRNNRISMIGDRSFVEMPELNVLDLDQNSIKYISENALDGMKNLKDLRLKENQLVTLESDFLAGAPSIYFLDLRNNALKTMTFDNIKPIVTNLYNSTSYFYLSGNRLICDCKLAWIWGLRNETKSTKSKDALEELTCFLESNNATFKTNNEDLERNQALEIARNPDGYLSDNLREGRNGNNDAYPGDAGDENYNDAVEYYDDTSSDSNSHPRVEIIEGKMCYMKYLFELKPEELPCPVPSREDLMASEQPSSRHENAHVGSSTWFSSTAESSDRSDPRSVLACTLMLLLSTLFT